MDVKQATDGELLREFAATGREEPFKEIVERHQRLVMGTCVRLVGRLHDAEDVTQGVFLILARKAGSLGGAKSVGGWLHRVAVDLCRDALKAAGRRLRREQEAAQVRDDASKSEGLWGLVEPILDEQVEKLPERYRRPVMAYYLEERTVDEIAQETGRTAAAVKQQLSRGRDMLRDRLARRGVAIPAGLLFGLIWKHAAQASASPTLVASTAKAASLLAGGKAVGAGLVSAKASALAQGGLKAIAVAKLKAATAAALVLGMTGAGAGVAIHKLAAPPRQETSSVELTPERFAAIYSLIRPEKTEAPWEAIPWEFCLLEARKKAAEQGKPIYIWAVGGDPTGAC